METIEWKRPPALYSPTPPTSQDSHTRSDVSSDDDPHTMGIQFVQVGGEPDTERDLRKPVHGDNGVRYGDRCVSSAI